MAKPANPATQLSANWLNEEEDESLPTLPKEVVEQLRTNIRELNLYSLEETQTRNILMVGRTRSGKSTAVGVLKDPCHEPENMSIFSQTYDPKFQSFALDDKKRSTKYTINVIDTPGLKEVKAKNTDPEKAARTDSVIINTINYCLKNEITKINTLIIFIAFELGVTLDDLDSFRSFLERFGHDEIMIVLCITRAEDKPKSWKEGIIQELRQHDYFSEVLNKKNLKTCFLGCVDGVKNKTTSSITDLQAIYKRVYQMREEILQVIFDSKKQVKLVDLPIAATVKNAVLDIFKNQNLILDYLAGITDFEVAEVKLKISQFAKLTTQMAENEGILYEPTINAQWITIKKRMEEILRKSTMSTATREIFIGNILLSA